MSNKQSSKSKQENAFAAFHDAISNFESFHEKNSKFDYFALDFFNKINTATVR